MTVLQWIRAQKGKLGSFLLLTLLTLFTIFLYSYLGSNQFVWARLNRNSTESGPSILMSFILAGLSRSF